VDACQALDSVELARVELYSGGIVPGVALHVQSVKNEISTYSTRQQAAQNALKTAIAGFKEKEQQTIPGKSHLEAVQEAAKSLQGRLNTIVKDGGAPATHVIATERLQH